MTIAKRSVRYATAISFSLITTGNIAFAGGNINPNTTQFDTGGVLVVSPLDGLREVMGPNGPEITIASAPGALNPLDDFQIDVVVFIHDANGVLQAITVFADVNGSADAANGEGAITPTEIDPAVSPLGANLRTAINTANAFVGVVSVFGGGTAVGVGIGLVVNDQSGNGVQTLLDLNNEGADMILEPDIDGPRLVRVIRDDRGQQSRMVMVFDDVVSSSMFENLDNTDFEFSSTQMGQFTAFARLSFPGSPIITPSADNRTLVFPIAQGHENLAPPVGRYVRIALPDNGETTNDALLDLALNPAEEQDPVIVELAQAADLNGDNEVTGVDLSMMLATWGPCGDPKSCPADLNGDGVVDAQDLGQLMASWTG